MTKVFIYKDEHLSGSYQMDIENGDGWIQLACSDIRACFEELYHFRGVRYENADIEVAPALVDEADELAAEFGYAGPAGSTPGPATTVPRLRVSCPTDGTYLVHEPGQSPEQDMSEERLTEYTDDPDGYVPPEDMPPIVQTQEPF